MILRWDWSSVLAKICKVQAPALWTIPCLRGSYSGLALLRRTTSPIKHGRRGSIMTRRDGESEADVERTYQAGGGLRSERNQGS